ncbi:ABC transporter permease [Actinoplanes sp. NPDC049265]|uniref:ABC transporter permease n=1 Tax=Actinoplanes sp. NPDC049265 TaxID=3363902 RepID=UPI00370FF6B5
MNPRPGLRQGLIELRQAFTGTELIGNLFWPVATLVAVVLLRDRGTLILPGTLGMFVAFGTLLMVQNLAADREDGTLLRAKAIPDGIRGYLIGKLVTVSATVLAYLTILLAPGLILFSGLTVQWPTLIWVVALGLIATQTIGAVLGSLISSSRGAGVLSLPVLALVATSGIFVPITALPTWVATAAKVFPVYWLGEGMRGATLAGGTWQLSTAALILGAWSLAGLVAAPVLLRRMSRLESGSRVAARRARLLRSVG